MKKIILIGILMIPIFLSAQDGAFGRRIVDTLTSPRFWGRGYTNQGMSKAAGFLSDCFQSYGLRPLSKKGFFQPFEYAVNTFPGKMKLSVNQKELLPGIDFIVGPESKGIHASGTLLPADSVSFIDRTNRLVLRLQKKLTWSVSSSVSDYTMVDVLSSSVEGLPQQYDINIDNAFIQSFSANNICGFVKGMDVPDSFIFITAHYDHLGGMGADTYFPGANDNASGIALLLNLARYYAKHPQRYSIAFLLFAGEEIGLKGSEYYTTHPLIPLSRIRFLLNTDLAGTGEDGITVVNATEFPAEFKLLNQVNDTLTGIRRIYPRGKAANSDHYHFSEKGVPAFFFYTMGGIQAYHDVYDRAETLPLNKHEALFTLVQRFIESLIHSNDETVDKNKK